MRKAERRKPCGNCPFRKEAPLAHWHPTMYEMLSDIEATEGDPNHRRSFGCHKDKGAPEEVEHCIGWLLDQRAHRIPSLQLRLSLSRDDAAHAQYVECEPDGEMYESVAELVEANRERDRELHPERYPKETT